MRTIAKVATLVVVALLVAAAAASAAPRRVVLGSTSFAGANGRGWGTARPGELFNGGDPSGLITRIRWSSWAGRTAFGDGRNPIFRPHGGYYRRPVTIRLHAVALGRCTPRGPLTYRQLYVREPVRPGGPLGRWLLWSGARSLCRSGF